MLRGFVRRIEKEIDLVVPKVVIELCNKYYLSKETYVTDHASLLNGLFSIETDNTNLERYDFRWHHTRQEQV